jgi:hypothetical protein
VELAALITSFKPPMFGLLVAVDLAYGATRGAAWLGSGFDRVIDGWNRMF